MILRLQKREGDQESGVRSFYDLVTRESSVARSVVRILLSPLFGLLDGAVFVVLPVISHRLVKRVVHVGGRHQGLDREQHGFDLEGGRPLVLQDVEADSACYI